MTEVAAGTVDIVEYRPGLYRAAIPIPSPLARVNCYIIRGNDGWTIIDTGFHTAEAKKAWAGVFRRLSLKPEHIVRIVVTHYHPDHFGSAGWLQQLSGAPVVMHAPEIGVAKRVWNPSFLGKMNAFLACHGVPPETISRLGEMAATVYRRVQPLPELTPVEEGEELPLGDKSYRPHCFPGHTDSLMVLVDEESDVMFCSDMLLTPITPNISSGPQTEREDPLGAYMDSLDKIAGMPGGIAFTGHRQPIEDVASRAMEIKEHHRERLEEAEHLARRHGPAPAWVLARHMFGPVMDTEANINFALGETVAHLDYLVIRGRLTATWSDGGQKLYGG